MGERLNMCLCGIKRVNGAGQASYGEADVRTYCPGLLLYTGESERERRTHKQQAGGEEGEKG